jgi:hypothetical protein
MVLGGIHPVNDLDAQLECLTANKPQTSAQYGRSLVIVDTRKLEMLSKKGQKFAQLCHIVKDLVDSMTNYLNVTDHCK